MIQLPDLSRLYDLFHVQVYGVPVVSILLLAGVASFLGAWYWRANMKSETKMVQTNESGLPSAAEFAEEAPIVEPSERTADSHVSSARFGYPPTPPIIKVEGYCVKCKTTSVIKDAREVKEKGRRVSKGVCEVCGTKMNKFLPSAPKFNGHADTEALLLGVMIERLKTANISGGRVSMIIDPTSEKTISLGRSQVDFDLGIPVSYAEHSTKVESLEAELAAVNAKLDSIAAAQEAEEKGRA